MSATASVSRSPRRTGFRDRVVELRRVPASELVENPRNWRRHPIAQRRALRALVAEIGFADALLARIDDDDHLVLLDGHLRKDLHPTKLLPVLVLDLSEAEGDALLATLDPLAGLAEPDAASLESLLGRVAFDDEAIEDLLRGLRRSAGLPVTWGLGDPEEIPALPGRAKTRSGEVWVLGNHRLACADAADPGTYERLMGSEQAGVLLTDPPFGIDYEGKTPARLRIAGDQAPGLEALLQHSFAAADAVLGAGAAIYVFHPAGPGSAVFQSAFVSAGWRWRQSLVWAKDAMVLGRSDYHYRHEPILYGNKPAPGTGRWGRGGKGWEGSDREDSVLEVPRPRASREHPTAKPVELLRRLLANSAAEGSVVLDPFAGSGSTVIACEEMGLAARAVEIDPRYCDVIVSRWEAFTGRNATRRTR